MERERSREHNGNYDQFLSDYDSVIDRDVPNREHSPSMFSSSSVLPISYPSISSSPPRPGYIEHPVSKLDTLAGIAIKYGVEVADIKKMNGLVTDLQMFALKTLQIPLPGRHPPSPCLSDGSTSSTTGHCSSNHIPTDHVHHELFESFQSLKLKSSQQKVSPAMSSLQGYYGLKQKDEKTISDGLEMAMYGKGGFNISENSSFTGNSPMSDQPLSHHRKSRSLYSGILDEIVGSSDNVPVAEAGEGDNDKSNDKLVRRRLKSEADFTRTSNLLLREDNGSSGGISSKAGKGLAQRQKAGSRAALSTNSEANGLNPVPIGLGDAFLTDVPSGVRKSSSTSCLQDQDNSNFSSIWPTTRWNLKPDLQAFSTAVIAKPIFDGLPKPITGRRHKAALD